MDVRPPVTLEAAVACGEIQVRAGARSPFRRVRVTLDGRSLELDRDGRYIGTLPRAADGQQAMVLVATAGRHQARVEIVPPAPYAVSATLAGDRIAGAPQALRFTPDPGCMRPELELPYVLAPGKVRGTANGAPFDADVTAVTAGGVEVVSWADAVDVEYALTWNGWTFPAETARFELVPPRIDGDGDGVTASAGDCDDHDPDIRPGAPDAPRDRRDADCDGAGGPSRRTLAPQEPTIAAGDRPVRATYLGEAPARHVVAVPASGEAWVALRSRSFQGRLDVALRVTATAPVDVEVWAGGRWSGVATVVRPPAVRPHAPWSGEGPRGMGGLVDGAPLLVARVRPDAPFVHASGSDRRRGGTLTGALVGGALRNLGEAESGSAEELGWVGASALALSAMPLTLFLDGMAWLASEPPPRPTDTLLYLRIIPADASVPLRTAEIRIGG